MGKNVDNDGHSREGRNEDLRLETNFSYPAHAQAIVTLPCISLLPEWSTRVAGSA